MRIHKKNIFHITMGLIHGLALLLPIAVASFTGIYAVINKNAYLSYAGYVDRHTENVYIEDKSDFILDKQYYFRNYQDLTDIALSRNDNLIYYNYFKFETSSNTYEYTNGYFGFYKPLNTNILYFYLWDSTNTLILNNYSIGTSYFTFTYNNITSNFNGTLVQSFYHIEEIAETYLDNAFDYGFQKCLDTFDYPNQSFSNVIDYDFLNLFGVSQNNVYTQFINFYINYMISMELIIFLPQVLLVFFEMIRKLIFAFVDKTDERSY